MKLLNSKIAAIVLICIAGSLGGCATTAIPLQKAKLVPAERIYFKEHLPEVGNARAIFVRDAGFTGSGVYQHVFIDGQKAASLNPGEKVELVLPPGEHILGVIPTDVVGTHSMSSIDQDMKAGRTYYYRVQTDGNSFKTVIQRYFPEKVN